MQNLDILIKRVREIPCGTKQGSTKHKKIIFLAELAKLGYRVTNPKKFDDSIFDNYAVIIKTLTEMKGGNVKYVPLFKGFPNKTPDPDEFFTKRVIGYIGNVFGIVEGKETECGIIVPEWLFDLNDFNAEPILGRQDKELYKKGVVNQENRKSDTHTEWVDLKIVSNAQSTKSLKKFMIQMLYSSASLQEDRQNDLIALLDRFGINDVDLGKVTFKETKTFVARYFWEKKNYDSVVEILKTPVDILRLFASLTDSDVSLAEPIKFPKLSRIQRRTVCRSLLNSTNLPEDLNRHRGLWLQVARYVHPNEMASRNKQFKVIAEVFSALAKDDIVTWNAKTETMIETAKNTGGVSERTLVTHLSKRPTEFARRIGFLMSVSSPFTRLDIVKGFDKIANEVPLKNLLVLERYIANIDDRENRTIINKIGKIKILPVKSEARIGRHYQEKLIATIRKAIKSQLSKRDSWKGKKVWLDEKLNGYIVPLQQRKMSEGLLSLARGTRYPIKEGKTLRLFTYWKQNEMRTDLDLSATILDKDMQYVNHVSYTQLKSGNIVHSGDLTSAPYGAAEFIDIPLQNLKFQGHSNARYIAIQVYIYAGNRFFEMPECYAGWMIRDKVKKGRKSFDIKTVQHKFDLNGKGSYSIPMLFDLKTKEIVYVDLYMQANWSYNRVEESLDNVSVVCKEVADFIETRPNMFDLACHHVAAREGTIVNDVKKADITFGFNDCDYDATKPELIASELL